MLAFTGVPSVPTAERSGSGTALVIVGLVVVLGLIEPGAAAV
jgi:hypothetical protein